MTDSDYQPGQSVFNLGSNTSRRLLTMGGYQHLYKYRSLAGESSNFTRDIVVNNSLYWPSASELNDPYECRPKIIWEATPHMMNMLYQGFMSDPQHAHLDDEARRAAFFAENRQISALRADDATKDFEAQRSENAVLSFSASYSEVLLWSHYADAHRGICLQFTPIAPSDLSNGIPVHYTDERPIYNALLFNGGIRYLLDFFATKLKIWEYEKEYRILKQHKVGLHPFKEGELTGIILGAQITEANKLKVSSWCDGLSNPPMIYQAELDSSTFAVRVPGLLA